MPTSTDILNLAFASQILAFLASLATCIAVIRYINPGPEYINLADLVAKIRQNWNEYESEGTPTDEYAISFLSTLERLEGEVRDLLFIMNTKSVKCQFRAWANAFRIKRLSNQAQRVRIGLPLIVQMIREVRVTQNHPTLTIEDFIALEEKSRSITKSMRFLEGDVNPSKIPVTSLENFYLRQFETTTPPEIVTFPETPALHAEDLEAGKLLNTRKRNILKKLFPGIRKKRDSSGLSRAQQGILEG